jgi:hypothetical protein
MANQKDGIYTHIMGGSCYKTYHKRYNLQYTDDPAKATCRRCLAFHEIAQYTGDIIKTPIAEVLISCWHLPNYRKIPRHKNIKNRNGVTSDPNQVTCRICIGSMDKGGEEYVAISHGEVVLRNLKTSKDIHHTDIWIFGATRTAFVALEDLDYFLVKRADLHKNGLAHYLKKNSSFALAK